MSAVLNRLGIFTLAMLAFGAALAWPAHAWGGNAGLLALGAAWLLSVVPGWILLALQSLVKTPQSNVFLALGSTVGRLLLVGFATLALLNLRVFPEFQFAVWVVACYLAALLVETGLVLQALPAGRNWAAVGDTLTSVIAVEGK